VWSKKTANGEGCYYANNTVPRLKHIKGEWLMREILLDVKNYEGLYVVSNFGKVYSVARNAMMKLEKIKGGYERVTLCKNGKTQRFLVHRLVANHFIPNPNNKPCVHHKDHTPNNNSSKNLEWVTYFENEEHNSKDGTRVLDGYKLTHDDVRELRRLKDAGVKNSVLAEKYGINERNVRRIHKRDTYKEVF
jgi:hypothetical protein